MGLVGGGVIVGVVDSGCQVWVGGAGKAAEGPEPVWGVGVGHDRGDETWRRIVRMENVSFWEVGNLSEVRC